MEQLQPSHSVDSLEEPAPVHSQAPLGAPPTIEGLTDITKGYINGKVSPKSHASPKRSPKPKYRKEPDVASLPTVTTGAITTHQQPHLLTVEQLQPRAIEQPQPKAIEYSRWRDRLLHPRLAAEQEVCVELERKLSFDEKQRWDTFRQYLSDAATGGNPQNKVEARAFQPFRNRTRLSWRVVEIVEHEGTIPKNGKAAQTRRGSPYICLEGVRTKENAQNLHAFLSQRKARAEYHPPFKLCYSLAHIEATFSPKLILPIREQDKTLYTLCGQLVVEKAGESSDSYSAFTIGGLVQIGEEVFALSCQHDTVSEQTTETDEGSGFSVEALQNSTDFDEDIDPALVLEPESPKYEPITTSQRTSAKEPPTKYTERSARQLTDLVGDMVLAGDEWCLYRVEDPALYLPNSVPRIPAPEGPLPEAATNTYLSNFATEPANGAVVVVGGRSGLVHARMSPNASDIFLPSGKVLEVWRIVLEQSREGIRHGDSGSWVVDLESGVVFGHIIAMTNNAAYVLPMVNIYRSGRTSQDWRLVSAFHCLANLAKLHDSSSPTLAEAFAREALSLEVLDQSDPTVDVCLLQAYLRTGQRSSTELAVLVRLLRLCGSRPHLALGSDSTWLQDEEDRIGSHNSIDQKLLDQLTKFVRLSQEYGFSKRGSSAQSLQPADIVEDVRRPSEYSVEDMGPEMNTATNPWIIFSSSRFSRRNGVLDTLGKADCEVIEREQRRVAYLRRHFGTNRVHSRDQGYLVDEMGSAHRLWRKSAASQADNLFRHGQGPYDRDFLSDLDLGDGEDDASPVSGWGYAGVITSHQEAKGTTRFKSQRLTMKHILSMASGALSQTDAPWHEKPVDMDGRIRYFHMPANNTRWVEAFMSAYYNVSGPGNLPYDQSLMQMGSHPNNPFRWNHRQHEGSLAPVYARQIMPHGSTNLLPPCDDSTEIERPDQYVSLFIPYLSSEEYSSVQRARHFVRVSDSTHGDQDRVPIAGQGTSWTRAGKAKQANPLVDFLGRLRGRTPFKGPGRRTANSNGWLPIAPLARYLICAARLYKLFEEDEMVENINLDVRGPLPVHMRRTLEQYRNWPSADNTDRQDMEQTTRQESLRQRKVRRRDGVNDLSSTLVMVDQLWLWILDDKTVLSSFPRGWGDRHGQSPTDVYSHVDRRLRSAHPEEIESAYDVALVIVEECSKALFRQNTGVDVLELYGSAIARLATTISAAYTTFKSDARAASIEDTLSSMGRLLRRSQGLSKEWRTLDEVERAMEELKAMGKVLSQQADVLTEFESILQRLCHDKAKNRASILVKEITTRSSEVEYLHSLAKAVTVEFGKLEDLQQQQVSTAHARIALQGVYEQGLHHANNSSSTTGPQYQINNKGRVVSARGRNFVEKNKGKDSGSSVMVNRDTTSRPSIWARMGEAVGLRKRNTASEKRLGAGTTTTSRMV